MTKVSIGVLLLTAGLTAVPVFAASDADKTPGQLCQDYAKEDGVPAESMETYITECVASLTAEGEVESEAKKPEESTGKKAN